MNIKPSEVKHLTDLELLKVKIDSGEMATAYLAEAYKRDYLSKLPIWYKWNH